MFSYLSSWLSGAPASDGGVPPSDAAQAVDRLDDIISLASDDTLSQTVSSDEESEEDVAPRPADDCVRTWDDAPDVAAPEAPLEAMRDEPVVRCQEEPLERYEEGPVEIYQETCLERYQDEPLEAYQEEPVERYQEEPLERYQEEPLERYQEEPLERYQEEPLEIYQKVPLHKYLEPLQRHQEDPLERYQEELSEKYHEPLERPQEEPLERYQDEPLEKYQEPLERPQEDPLERHREEPVERCQAKESSVQCRDDVRVAHQEETRATIPRMEDAPILLSNDPDHDLYSSTEEESGLSSEEEEPCGSPTVEAAPFSCPLKRLAFINSTRSSFLWRHPKLLNKEKLASDFGKNDICNHYSFSDYFDWLSDRGTLSETIGLKSLQKTKTTIEEYRKEKEEPSTAVDLEPKMRRAEELAQLRRELAPAQEAAQRRERLLRSAKQLRKNNRAQQLAGNHVLRRSDRQSHVVLSRASNNRRVNKNF